MNAVQDYECRVRQNMPLTFKYGDILLMLSGSTEYVHEHVLGYELQKLSQHTMR